MLNVLTPSLHLGTYSAIPSPDTNQQCVFLGRNSRVAGHSHPSLKLEKNHVPGTQR